MKYTLILATLMAATLSQAYGEEPALDPTGIHSSFSYGTVGIGPLPVPALTVGVGHRFSLNGNGAIDLGCSGATLFILNTVRANADILGYFGKTPTSHYYAGLGATGGILFGEVAYDVSYYAAPNFVAGKDYMNNDGKKRFVQLETVFPLVSSNLRHDWLEIPLFTIKYGIAF